MSAGGAIFTEMPKTTLIFKRNKFLNNQAYGGGGCDIDVSQPIISTSEFYNNSFTKDGTVTCNSGIMLALKSTLVQTCDSLGQWTAPAPFAMPPTTFVGCTGTCDPGRYGNTYTLTSSACTAPCTVGHCA